MNNLPKELRQGELMTELTNENYKYETFLGKMIYLYDDDEEHVYICINKLSYLGSNTYVALLLRKEDLEEILTKWKIEKK